MPQSLGDDDFVDDGSAPAREGGRPPRGVKSSTPTWVIVLILLAGGPLAMCPCLIALLLPAVQQAREAARRTQSRGHLKQIGLGVHYFHDAFEHFPPLGIEGDLPPEEQLQSWQVDILHYLDQGPLYNQIQRDKPWDDPANQTAFSVIIPTFHNPSVPAKPTNEQGYALSHYAANSRVMSATTRLSLADITDGTSNTLLAGDVREGFRPWGDPANARDPARGLQGTADTFGSYHVGGRTFCSPTARSASSGKTSIPPSWKAWRPPTGANPLRPSMAPEFLADIAPTALVIPTDGRLCYGNESATADRCVW